MNWKTRLRILLLGLVVLSAFFLILRAVHQRTKKTARNSPNWAQLSRESSSSLEAKEFQKIHEQEHFVFEQDPTPQSLGGYMEFALNCAKARRLAAYADSYVLLRAAEGALNRTGIASANVTQVLDLAEEFLYVHSYRRAFDLIEQVPNSRRDQKFADFERNLNEVFSVLRSTLPVNETPALSREDQRFQDELYDLLGAVPENPYYDEVSLADESLKGKNVVEKLRSKPSRQLSAALPFLFAMPGSVSGKDSVLGVESRSDKDWKHQQLTPLDLSPQEKSSALEFIRASKLPRSELLRKIRTDEFSSRLLAKLSAEEILEPFTKDNLQDVFPQPDGAILVYYKTEESWIFVLHGRDLESVKGFVFHLLGFPSFDSRDVTGDGIPELIASARNGSGGFLDIVILDVSVPKVVWSAEDLPQGIVTFVRVEDTDASQIIAVSKTALGEEDCGVCPARYESSLYRYDVARRTFLLSASRLTFGEMEMAPHKNIAGYTPEMVLGLRDSQEGGSAEQAARTILRRLRSTPAPWSRATFKQTVESFGELHDLLSQARRFETDAELLGELIDTLNRRNLSPEWTDFRHLAQYWRITSFLGAGDFEQATSVVAQPGFVVSSNEKADLADSYNVTGLCYQTTGKMYLAYDAYVRALQNAKGDKEREAAVEGNLAWYFRMIGDPQTAYMHAAKALDLATETQNELRAAIDMAHLAAASAALGRDEESLEWLGRSLRITRTADSGGVSTMALEIASDIALAHNRPDLAFKLLDEAVSIVDQAVWSTEGGKLMLLYARAALQQKDNKHALGLLKVSTRLSKDVSTSTYVTALYELSRLNYAVGSSTEALDYARQAFGAANSGRQIIGEEQQKFSFLADKSAVASWLFKLMSDSKEDPLAVLAAVESWKMQTFIEVYDQASERLASPEPMTEQIKNLLNVMDDDDMFLDYVIGPDFSFVISVSKANRLNLYPLAVTKHQLETLIRQISQRLDIRIPQSLEAIRHDNMNREFDADLALLYRYILQPVLIPTGTKRLIISPDEALFGTPWSALKIDASEFLADKYESVLVPSALVGVRAAARALDRHRRGSTEERTKALVVCALDGVSKSEVAQILGERDFAPLAPLRNGWNECKNVADAVRPANTEMLLDGQTLHAHFGPGEFQATPEEFGARAVGSSVIHVVAHGIFNRIQPMRSVLFLDAGGSGRTITAADVAKLDLSSVDLATLSSCETGVSGSEPGAEPVGFLRGALGAGASSLLLAGWEVDDKTTAEMLSDFYDKLHHERKSRALRSAQAQIRNRFRHPYYWAGLNLYGYWN